jgi:hypothetical protein
MLTLPFALSPLYGLVHKSVTLEDGSDDEASFRVFRSNAEKLVVHML